MLEDCSFLELENSVSNNRLASKKKQRSALASTQAKGEEKPQESRKRISVEEKVFQRQLEEALSASLEGGGGGGPQDETLLISEQGEEDGVNLKFLPIPTDKYETPSRPKRNALKKKDFLEDDASSSDNDDERFKVSVSSESKIKIIRTSKKVPLIDDDDDDDDDFPEGPLNLKNLNDSPAPFVHPNVNIPKNATSVKPLKEDKSSKKRKSLKVEEGKESGRNTNSKYREMDSDDYDEEPDMDEDEYSPPKKSAKKSKKDSKKHSSSKKHKSKKSCKNNSIKSSLENNCVDSKSTLSSKVGINDQSINKVNVTPEKLTPKDASFIRKSNSKSPISKPGAILKHTPKLNPSSPVPNPDKISKPSSTTSTSCKPESQNSGSKSKSVTPKSNSLSLSKENAASKLLCSTTSINSSSSLKTPPSQSLKTIPKWTPPTRIGNKSVTPKGEIRSSPSLGIRVGLSRNFKASKPLHANVKFTP